ncbi:mucin-22-like [Periplaneta americana]|uniref:mucin-22-like n=1 Tax=Periplaneta americana TaxID=6978 RepID=UPI0037E80AC1
MAERRSSTLLSLFGAILTAHIAIAAARAVNISNTWFLPQEGFPVFYRYFRDRITWFEADAVCQFHHANLVTVDSSKQYDTTRAYLKELDVVTNVWIGLKKKGPNDEFAWTDYKTLAQDGGYWQEQIPKSEASLCAAIDPVADFRWHSLNCGGPETASFICELPVPPWARKVDGCMLTSLPSLTVTYLPEQAAVELTSDCGLDGTRRIACKGQADRNEMMRQLSCNNGSADPADDDRPVSASTTTLGTPGGGSAGGTESHQPPTRHRRDADDVSPPLGTLAEDANATTTPALSTATSALTAATTQPSTADTTAAVEIITAVGLQPLERMVEGPQPQEQMVEGIQLQKQMVEGIQLQKQMVAEPLPLEHVATGSEQMTARTLPREQIIEEVQPQEQTIVGTQPLEQMIEGHKDEAETTGGSSPISPLPVVTSPIALPTVNNVMVTSSPGMPTETKAFTTAAAISEYSDEVRTRGEVVQTESVPPTNMTSSGDASNTTSATRESTNIANTTFLASSHEGTAIVNTTSFTATNTVNTTSTASSHDNMTQTTWPLHEEAGIPTEVGKKESPKLSKIDVNDDDEESRRRQFLPSPLRGLPHLGDNQTAEEGTKAPGDWVPTGTQQEDGEQTPPVIETEPEIPARPNRGRRLTRPQGHSFYPYFLNRVLG